MEDDPLAPCLLVAMDPVVDPNFRRSVVLVLHHDEQEGSVGLVVNRATDLSLATLCESLDLEWKGPRESLVDWGGPVQPNHGWVLLGDEEFDHLDVEEAGPGLRFTRSQEVLREVARRPPLRARVFLGYAGWGGGQLEREIAEGSWLVVPASARLVFESEPEHLWEDAVRSLGIEPATLIPTQGVN